MGLGNDDSWSANVTFSWVLTDGTHTLTVGTTRRVTSSDEEDSPYWQQVTAPLPAAGSFDLTHVTGYTFTAWSSSGRLYPDDLYLDTLTAVPTTSAVVPVSRGTVYTLLGVQGSARAPMSMLVQQPPVTDPATATFTTAGPVSFTPPAGVTTCQVEKWGGGGRGGRRTTSGQGGGGHGGEYTANATFACSPGVPISGYVGAGGAVGAGTANFVQRVAAGSLPGGSGTVITAPVSANMASAHTLLVFICPSTTSSNGTCTVSTLTDTQGNTYTLDYRVDQTLTGYRCMEVWRCNPAVPLTTADHLTATLNRQTTIGASLIADEYGLLGALDTTPAYHVVTAGGINTNAVAGTMTASDAVSVAANAVMSGNVGMSVTSPFTSTGSHKSSGVDLLVARRAAPGAGTSTATFNWDPSHTAIAVILGYPAAAVGGTVNGEDTWFGAYDSTAAHGGIGVADNTATGSTTQTGTSTDVVHYAGGTGATGTASGGGGGGEGGSSAGTGNNGAVTAGGTGRADAGDGGAGGASGGNNAGTAGVQPGGGGGGSFSTGGVVAGGNGGAGKILITYIPGLTAFKSWIAHRPGEDAPDMLSPIVPVGNGADTPNGLTEYVVPQPVDGQNARFAGTYSVILAASSVNAPTVTRNIDVTITQYEYAGGPSVSVVVGAPAGVDIIPTGTVSNNLFVIGEISLPLKDLPADNVSAYYTVKVADTNTADRFMDCLFLDVQGQTAGVGMIPGGTLDSGSGYPNFWLDEPTSDTDLGQCLASTYGRGQAASVIDSAILTGGPLTIDPGDNPLLMYSPAGQPAVVCSYMPRWMADRPQ